ncbi:hypothetical protein GOP47_0014454 [Adiantum capillus-veneris]|uniref:Uncharacterized protein n=1 Tax=Adiantum capillus-veneris TaxID=13818 RepID=A0A9D4UMA5_ADICA|nr:hypothetical protein GOP47_0014454 [Adiantum capillus-veneris]
MCQRSPIHFIALIQKANSRKDRGSCRHYGIVVHARRLAPFVDYLYVVMYAHTLVHGGIVSFLLASALTSNIPPPSALDTMQNVPSTISGFEKAQRIQKPNSAKAESCTRKCVGTCIRGGGGAPGEGPLNVRKPLVVFKEGFRSRNYCLVECSEICNIIGNGDDGP